MNSYLNPLSFFEFTYVFGADLLDASVAREILEFIRGIFNSGKSNLFYKAILYLILNNY